MIGMNGKREFQRTLGCLWDLMIMISYTLQFAKGKGNFSKFSLLTKKKEKTRNFNNHLVVGLV